MDLKVAVLVAVLSAVAVTGCSPEGENTCSMHVQYTSVTDAGGQIVTTYKGAGPNEGAPERRCTEPYVYSGDGTIKIGTATCEELQGTDWVSFPRTCDPCAVECDVQQ